MQILLHEQNLKLVYLKQKHSYLKIFTFKLKRLSIKVNAIPATLYMLSCFFVQTFKQLLFDY